MPSRRRRHSGAGRPGAPPEKPRLKQLTFDFEERLVESFERAGKALWVYYFPFLYCYGRTAGRDILYTRSGDSHVLFLERETERGTLLDLVVPPIPLTREAVDFARGVVAMRRRPRPARILWVDEADAAALGAMGLDVIPKEEEYVLEPAKVVGPDADLPKRLRKKLKKAEEFGPQVVPFAAAFVSDAMDLLDGLVERDRQTGVPPLDYDYTLECLDLAPKLMARGMIGLAVLVRERLAGFAFGGRMTSEMANFFILKTDPEYPGLAEWLRVEFLRAAAGFRYVNDAGDLGMAGLAQHKRQFMPVRMLQAFTVRKLPP